MTKKQRLSNVESCDSATIAGCTVPCRVGKSPEPAAEHIFLINCLAAIRSVLEDQDCCRSKHLILTKDIQQHLTQLVDEDATQVLQSCGFKAQLEHDRYGCINATGWG